MLATMEEYLVSASRLHGKEIEPLANPVWNIDTGTSVAAHAAFSLHIIHSSPNRWRTMRDRDSHGRRAADRAWVFDCERSNAAVRPRRR